MRFSTIGLIARIDKMLARTKFPVNHFLSRSRWRSWPGVVGSRTIGCILSRSAGLLVEAEMAKGALDAIHDLWV